MSLFYSDFLPGKNIPIWFAMILKKLEVMIAISLSLEQTGTKQYMYACPLYILVYTFSWMLNFVVQLSNEIHEN